MTLPAQIYKLVNEHGLHAVLLALRSTCEARVLTTPSEKMAEQWTYAAKECTEFARKVKMRIGDGPNEIQNA